MTQIATARPLQRSTPRSAKPQPLRVVRQQAKTGQPGFVAACLALLVAGLLGVLMLNTAMAKGSFVLGDLQDTSNELAAAEEELHHTINAQSAPAELAKRALGMGMVPSTSAAFLRLSDGKVLGVAEVADTKKEFTVATQGSSAAAAARPATTPQTTVKTVGTVTTTTVTTVKGDDIEVRTTSVDSRTGATQTTTATRKVPVTPVPPATPNANSSAAPNPGATPTPGASAGPKPTASSSGAATSPPSSTSSGGPGAAARPTPTTTP
ncbi:hypothetical protein N802_10330 [Knoellia sinensis KCTC 19936]|uniref:Cell division protein FtsL n=1 Tax=Knoellia sinensis KCTC 19936 TaxID=1385520 RepID=A0A0A0J138_9MICO|nr:hypothetical protein [Knoellia sinensis]KGN29882.1 hypothetical protein N802_10330 [Knoellia sinensis KCTC 19936]